MVVRRAVRVMVVLVPRLRAVVLCAGTVCMVVAAAGMRVRVWLRGGPGGHGVVRMRVIAMEFVHSGMAEQRQPAVEGKQAPAGQFSQASEHQQHTNELRVSGATKRGHTF